MILKTIEIKNFRNHIHTQIEFSENLNLIVGGNAQGKTSILEAISYLCLTKSFNASSDSYVLNFNSKFFEVLGKFEFDNGHEAIVRVSFENGQGKKIFLNKEPVEKFSILISKFPIVILSPRSKETAQGSPEERRKFFDLTIAQVSSVYTDELIDYKKILKQRNKILNAIANDEIKFEQGIDLLEVWDETFVNYASRIILRRKKFISEFIGFFKNAYSKFNEVEEPEIEYVTQIDIKKSEDFETLKGNFREILLRSRNEEIKRGITLVGPHRDEFVFKINGRELRRFASQGQVKTFLVALTIAKFFYLKEKKIEKPIILLDDVFAELDIERTEKLLSIVGNIGQSFITATDSETIKKFEEKFKVKKFIVNSGVVKDA
ncbi:DNA replication/repair protein RecF [Candidatus Chrysopegis kryptomonas]|jgi:DNA replication and repair protein RecF|uniref:DNA replication and repair protein RecF n=1 Tax=Candidatus Chryseopegocella kryptomonas TaxID=1633643 RepID=A0A0P1MNN4_9BACT|nr:DNA replication/repair protein RecF [Candidatus Chrysopegis kryptomonas]CUS97205.1 DNA replication and repair protein RecF [Candidatus Chrysopegis kryptomonas]